ncbi:MAG: hypothetical protein WCW02_03335 [Candidatus Buchananbacteria bacterium]
MTKKFITFLSLTLLIVFTTMGFSCTSSQPTVAAPVTLKYWRVWDDQENFTDIINAYHSLHPNVTIEYKKLRYEEYEQALLEAWAEDRGPDIFSIHNTWLKKYQNKISPLPAQTTINYQTTNKTWFKTDTTVTNKITPTLTARQLKDNFVATVYDDVYFDNNIWGLPLSVDTLVMFYNRDLLTAAGVATPPTNWLDLQKATFKITKKSKDDTITVAGAALGTGKNISRSFDILSLLIMQNGGKMVDANNNPSFNTLPAELRGRTETPGEGALTFYTDFANPTKEVYSWNTQMPNSLDAFVSGKVGFFFGYAYQWPLIKTQAPNLNLGISSVPQVDSNYPVNYANYWVETTAKKIDNTKLNWAWDFIQFATNAKQVTGYLNRAQKPTALISLIDKQKENEDLRPFAEQLLTAKSWNRGQNPNLAEQYFIEMIDSVVSKQTTIKAALDLAASKIKQTIR